MHIIYGRKSYLNDNSRAAYRFKAIGRKKVFAHIKIKAVSEINQQMMG